MSERTASTFRKGHSQFEVDLVARLNTAKIDVTWGDAYPTGDDSFRIPDVVVQITRGLMMAVEVMGDGSKSDDAGRHESLLAHGFWPLYLTNDQVKHSPEMCVQRIRQTRNLLRSLLSP